MGMKVLVIGQGGREHALCKAIKVSPSVTSVFISPGNDGMAQDAEIVNLRSHQEIRQFCQAQNISLVVIGPEADLVAGLADHLRQNDILVFGPSQIAAQLEGSKIYCKEFLNEFHVPTARSHVVNSIDAVRAAIQYYQTPYVLKADGLCAGKGVFICKNETELLNAAKLLFEDQIFGEAGKRALLEEFQPGYELSVLYLTNGKEFSPMPICQDHKRLLDNDQGPNTGGMGVVGPMQIDAKLWQKIEQDVLKPIQQGFIKRKFDFCGVLYVGLMITEAGPSVLEFNVRFGDPEAQVILPLLHGDWAEVFKTIAQAKTPHLNWRDEFAACVVLASEGYPDQPKKGVRIAGDAVASTNNSYFIHAGTKNVEGHFVTNGGRVLNAIGLGFDLKTAIERAYAQAEHVNWPGMQMRTDIGSKAN